MVFSTSVFEFSDSVFPMFSVSFMKPILLGCSSHRLSKAVQASFFQLPFFSYLVVFANVCSCRIIPGSPHFCFFDRNMFFFGTRRRYEWQHDAVIFFLLLSLMCVEKIVKMDPLLMNKQYAGGISGFIAIHNR